VLLSAEGRRPKEIARGLRCATQTVRNGIRAFNAAGLGALTAGSSRPTSAAPVLGEAELERLRAILHRSPRAFGHARSTWTLALLAEVAHAEGLSETVLSLETIRRALLRLGVGWKRAKRWLTSPDPAYAQKNVGATGWSPWPGAGPAGPSASRTRSGSRASPSPPCTPGRPRASGSASPPRTRPSATIRSPKRWPATACG
jgi:transposase